MDELKKESRLDNTNKVMNFLYVLTAILFIFNLLHGLISPKTFFSMVGEGVLAIEFGILVWGLIIGTLLGFIPYQYNSYKIRFRFWFLIFICLQNIMYIFINVTEYLN